MGYRNAKVSKTFIPGGTTQNDFNIRAVLRLKDDLELNAFGQAEFWKVPALASGRQNDFTGSLQLTYFPQEELAEVAVRAAAAGKHFQERAPTQRSLHCAALRSR